MLSVQNKLSELEAIVNDLNPDFILLTETWYNSQINNASLNISGYSLKTDLRRDRQDTGQGLGGGLLVYSRHGLMIVMMPDFENKFYQHCRFQLERHGMHSK
jgi:hypothetical protein